MRVLGVTGGIGMGKSAVGDFVRSRGYPVVDTDDHARQVVRPGEPALAEVVERFGRGILTPAGELDRKTLARIVFASEAERQALEAILHPRIRQAWLASATLWKAQGHPIGAVIIPLLFETNAEKEVDEIVCIACSEKTQQQRLAARGWSSEQIRQRISAQMPVPAKMARADFVIWSEGNLEVTHAQLAILISKLAI